MRKCRARRRERELKQQEMMQEVSRRRRLKAGERTPAADPAAAPTLQSEPADGRLGQITDTEDGPAGQAGVQGGAPEAPALSTSRGPSAPVLSRGVVGHVSPLRLAPGRAGAGGTPLSGRKGREQEQARGAGGKGREQECRGAGGGWTRGFGVRRDPKAAAPPVVAGTSFTGVLGALPQGLHLGLGVGLHSEVPPAVAGGGTSSTGLAASPRRLPWGFGRHHEVPPPAVGGTSSTAGGLEAHAPPTGCPPRAADGDRRSGHATTRPHRAAAPPGKKVATLKSGRDLIALSKHDFAVQREQWSRARRLDAAARAMRGESSLVSLAGRGAHLVEQARGAVHRPPSPRSLGRLPDPAFVQWRDADPHATPAFPRQVLEWLSSPCEQQAWSPGAEGGGGGGKPNPGFWNALDGLPVDFEHYPHDLVVDCNNSDYDWASLCSALGAFEDMHVQDCRGSQLADEPRPA